MNSVNTAKVISKVARYYGDKTALVCWETQERRSFRETDERTNRLAKGLLDLGLVKGDRVATLNNNCPQHVEMVFASIKSGAVRVNVNTRLSASDKAWLLNNSEAKVLFVGQEYLDEVRSIRAELKTVKHFISISDRFPGMMSYEELIADCSPEAPDVELDDDEIGLLMYTGGTSGKPKGVALPRRSDMAVTRNLLLDQVPDITSRDIFLAIQPLFHGAGLLILATWIRGLTHVTVAKTDPEIAFKVIEKERVSFVKTVPTVLIRLLNHPDIDKHDLSSIRTIIYGAAPMPAEKLKEGIRRFGPIFIQGYGQTEALATITTLGKEDHKLEGRPQGIERLSSAGKPFTYVDVRVVDDSGKEVPVGETGEVIVRGDHIMKGYWKLPQEQTDQKLRNGWIYTGDIGKMDEQGYLYLVDRKGMMIVTGGLNVFPNEVENVLYQYPGIAAAAVFGVPDEQWGEAVKAAIVLKPGVKATEEEIIGFCKSNLAHYKAPKSVDFRERLPQTDTGKILIAELRDPYWKGYTRRIH
jgi:long-chain acyl-CoA synthetase